MAIQKDFANYDAFVEKFKGKKTTDDCYTPPEIYDAVASWVEAEYNLSRDQFVRPFYPGGDFVRENYPDDCVVVDNPPFSILAKIVDFYNVHGIKYFLFAPGLTNFGYINRPQTCAICTDTRIKYHNGAVVNTGFITNLEGREIIARSAPELTKAIDQAQATPAKKKNKYDFPDHVLTSARLNRFSKNGLTFKVPRGDARVIGKLSCMTESIFGNGILVSDRIAAAVSKNQKIIERKEQTNRSRIMSLSEKEIEIVKTLSESNIKTECGERKDDRQTN